jgi:hypothetical protein
MRRVAILAACLLAGGCESWAPRKFWAALATDDAYAAQFDRVWYGSDGGSPGDAGAGGGGGGNGGGNGCR